MREIADVLKQLVKVNIFDRHRSVDFGVKDWIRARSYFIDTPISSSVFVLRAFDRVELTTSLGNDSLRFQMAALESCAGIRQESGVTKHMAWAAIRAYYSAFFAAHSILRVFGCSCIQLVPVHVSAVTAIARSLGMDSGGTCAERGFYICQISSTGDELSCRKFNDSHGDVWKSLALVLNEAMNAIPGTVAVQPHKRSAIAFLVNLLSVMSKEGSNQGNWLSAVRNEVNYQLPDTAWFPYRNADRELLSRVERNAGLWHTDSLALPHAVPPARMSAFFSACFDLVRLSRMMTTLLMESAVSADSKNGNNLKRLARQLARV